MMSDTIIMRKTLRGSPACVRLVIAVLSEHGMSGSLDLIALPDQTPGLRDDHTEHGDRHGILIDWKRNG